MTRPPQFVRRRNWRPVFELADSQGGVLTTRQLYECGVTPSEVRNHLRVARWRKVTTSVIALRPGQLSDEGDRWAAVLYAGPRAQLDGVSSLVAGGLERFTIRDVRVSVPPGVKVTPVPGWDVRPTRWWSPDDLAPVGVPRTRNDIAAVRGAIWSTSDNQAATLLSMVVQQNLATPTELGLQLLSIQRAKRRDFLTTVIGDLLDGARALGELDVARELRRRGYPPPARQVLREGSGGRYYLDLYWPELGIVVEIDGIQHAWAENIVADALRHNDIALNRDVVLRIPILGLRLRPDEFYGQIGRAIDEATARRSLTT